MPSARQLGWKEEGALPGGKTKQGSQGSCVSPAPPAAWCSDGLYWCVLGGVSEIMCRAMGCSVEARESQGLDSVFESMCSPMACLWKPGSLRPKKACVPCYGSFGKQGRDRAEKGYVQS
jgi:hypothetical protein